MKASPGRWALGLPLAAGALYLLQLPLYRGYLTDDTFIYARLAQNLARTGEMVFNPSEAVHAATSPLWAAVAGLGAWLGVEPFPLLKTLGMLCGLASVLLFARVALRTLPSATWAALTTAVFATEPWFVRWSASGMETALGVLLLVVVLDAGSRVEGEVRWGRLGWAVGLGPLVRPELALLLALVALRALGSREGRRRTRLWLGLALPLLLWSAYAWPLFGRIWPETLRAKSTPLGLVPGRLLANLRVLAQILALGAAGPVLLAAFGWRPRRLLPRAGGAWIAPVLWAWVTLLPLAYLLRDVQVVSRYLELILPVLVLLGSQVAARSRARRWWRGVWAAQAVLALGLGALWIAPSVREFSRTLDVGLGDIAGWLRENSAEDAVVAIYDIGLVGYRSDRRILDLGGLVQPGINRLRDRLDDREILLSGRFLEFGDPDYLVDRDPLPEALADLEIGDRRCVPILSRRVANLGLSRADPVVYTLYRLEPARDPRP